MREVRCAAVQGALLRQHEAAPRGKNGSIAGAGGGRERRGFLGGIFFLAGVPGFVGWSVSSLSYSPGGSGPPSSVQGSPGGCTTRR